MKFKKIKCPKCGKVLAEVSIPAEVYCKTCKTWAGGNDNETND